MDIQTFFALQRARMGKLDQSPLDLEIRKVRFENAEGSPGWSTAMPEPYNIGLGHWDSVRAGYRTLKLLYV